VRCKSAAACAAAPPGLPELNDNCMEILPAAGQAGQHLKLSALFSSVVNNCAEQAINSGAV